MVGLIRKKSSKEDENMNKNLRVDILLSLVLPYLIGILLNHFLFSDPSINYLFFYLGCLTILIGLFVENMTNDEMIKVKSKDSGIVSGGIISVALLLISLNTYHQVLFVFPTKLYLWTFIIGVIVFSTGGYLRVRAKSDLKGHFSHSLKIDENHKLITSGLYRKMRHPAYTGTLLILLGTSLIFNSWFGIILIALLSPLGIKRIENEEQMMISRFGDEYKAYMNRVKRIIPHVY